MPRRWKRSRSPPWSLADPPAQKYSFRYFQQLNGSVMLPADFTPQRVRVSLRGDSASLDQAIAWEKLSATTDT